MFFKRAVWFVLTPPPSQLCKGYATEFRSYFEYCRSLRFEDRPDYAYLKRLFKELFYRKGFQYDNMFDWTVLNLQQERSRLPPERPLMVDSRQASAEPRADGHYRPSSREEGRKESREQSSQDQRGEVSAIVVVRCESVVVLTLSLFVIVIVRVCVRSVPEVALAVPRTLASSTVQPHAATAPQTLTGNRANSQPQGATTVYPRGRTQGKDNRDRRKLVSQRYKGRKGGLGERRGATREGRFFGGGLKQEGKEKRVFIRKGCFFSFVILSWNLHLLNLAQRTHTITRNPFRYFFCH